MGRRFDALEVHVSAEEEGVPAGQLFVQIEVEADGCGALVLVCDVAKRIALPALIATLLARAVDGEGERAGIEKGDALLEIARVEKVSHQVAQVCDQVAVSAEQLVETFTAIL